MIENQHRKFFLLHTSEGEVYHLNFNASLADKIDDLNSDSHFEFSGLKLHSGNLDEYIVPSPPNAPTIWGSNHHHFHVQDFSQVLSFSCTLTYCKLFNFPHLEATKEIFDPQESVSLRRMVVLLLNFKDASIDCSTTEIEARLWQNTFSGMELASFTQNRIHQIHHLIHFSQICLRTKLLRYHRILWRFRIRQSMGHLRSFRPRLFSIVKLRSRRLGHTRRIFGYTKRCRSVSIPTPYLCTSKQILQSMSLGRFRMDR